MTASPTGSPAAQRIALRIEQDVPCPDCGYNLRGLRMDGRCPECGRPTIDTFARPLRASTGVMAEEMLVLPGKLLAGVLGWWIARSIAGAMAPVPGRMTLVVAIISFGLLLLMWLQPILRLRRQARSRRGGSSKPLQDIATPWLLLGLLAVALAFGSMGLTLFGPRDLPLLVWFLLILGACAAAAGAQFMAGAAATVVLRRLVLKSPALAVPVLGVAQFALVAACVVPTFARWTGALLSLSVLAVLTAIVFWLVVCYRIISYLREAQGSVVSLGKRT